MLQRPGPHGRSEGIATRLVNDWRQRASRKKGGRREVVETMLFAGRWWAGRLLRVRVDTSGARVPVPQPLVFGLFQGSIEAIVHANLPSPVLFPIGILGALDFATRHGRSKTCQVITQETSKNTVGVRMIQSKVKTVRVHPDQHLGRSR
jgi:hypothetical protein